jgi:hypothetical protein
MYMKVDTGASGIKEVKVNYPSNSKKDRESRKVEKVTTGKVTTRKKGTGKKLFESFVGEDINSVTSYIIHDVLIPAAKSTLSDMVQGGIEMLLFGERKGSRTTRDKSKSYVSYSSYSNNKRDDRREFSNRSRTTHSFDDIVLASRGEAEEVLSHLVDLTIDYGEATVSDLYDLVGITGSFTDNKYGWTDLSRASVTRARDGYLLNLPKTMVLD